MKLIKRVFFDTENNDIGHCTIYKKPNGNTYLVYFIEERYNTFQEYDNSQQLIKGEKYLPFKMKNQVDVYL